MPFSFERKHADVVSAKGSFSYGSDRRIGLLVSCGLEQACSSACSREVSYASPGLGDCRGSVEDEEEEAASSAFSSSSSSSIGRNSDGECSPGRSSDGGEGEGEGEGEEVQSEYKGGGALNNLEALEEVLPIKRSISQFYRGKSKSFTSLGDAASCSIEDIAKPENAYTRKRKNLLAYGIWKKSCIGIQRSNNGGISKRHANSKSMLSVAAAVSCVQSCNDNEHLNLNPPFLGSPCLPPLPPQARRSAYNDLSSLPVELKSSPWRSFSLSDLQGVAAVELARK